MTEVDIYVKEISVNVEIEIAEADEEISLEILDPKVIVGESTYTINFDANGTQYGFYSKHFGNITSIETTNIDSYTIDDAAVSLPKSIELNTTYLVEIVKSGSGTAQMIITVQPSEYDGLINTIDFTIGDGTLSYVLSRSGNCLYKLDSTLLTPANTSGVGTWTVDPLISTITLPTLPSGGGWDKMVYLKDNKFLIAGGNMTSGNKWKYFCYVDLDDNITDLDATPSGYTSYESASGGKPIYWLMYDFVNDVVYFCEYYYELDVIRLDLNTNTFLKDNEVNHPFCFRTDHVKNKIYFNPYRQAFIDDSEILVDGENLIAGKKISVGANELKRMFNRKTNINVIIEGYYFKEIDPNTGYLIASYTLNTILLMAFTITVDYDNDTYVAMHRNNKIALYKPYDGNNSKAFYLTNPTPGLNYLNCGMYACSNIHILCSVVNSAARFGGLDTRVQCIDASDPTGTAQPDFNYWDLPGGNTIDDIYTNRLL